MESEYEVIYFSAPWCSPCKNFNTVLDKVKEKFPQITFDKCNVEEYPQVASLYKIRGVPALVLKAHGDINDTIFGTLTENQLESLINNLTDR